jgi:hypothetical protein
MTQAVATVREGHAFQARQFWRKALRLLEPDSAIVKVGFEHGPKGYDDIWVEYAPGRGYADQKGERLRREHIQCKWHVASGEYGYADLVVPGFINANAVSLLQRARAAQLDHAPDGIGSRFRLLSNWHVATKDTLCTLVNQRDGSIRLERLFDGTTDASGRGKVRKLWCTHLEVDEDELAILVRTLAFGTEPGTLLDLRDNVDLLIERYGLRRVPLHEDVRWYDDLTYQWLAQGRIEFDANGFRKACEEQGLFEASTPPVKVFGVKSFEHPVDHLEERCIEVLDVIRYFDERPVRSDADWARTLYPQLKSFLLSAARRHSDLRLVLDAHVTLAFAAGSILNIKAGVNIELEQRVLNRLVWRPDDAASDPAWPGWVSALESLPGTGDDTVVAVSLTHDVQPAVRAAAQQLSSVSQLLVVALDAGAGNRKVVSGRHAFDLAESLAQQLARVKKPSGTVHLFIAAPNGFTFFLGQRQPSMGRTVLYEYDFEGANGGGYRASLTLPVPAAPRVTEDA